VYDHGTYVRYLDGKRRRRLRLSKERLIRTVGDKQRKMRWRQVEVDVEIGTLRVYRY
jgi:hypothetical protein